MHTRPMAFGELISKHFHRLKMATIRTSTASWNAQKTKALKNEYNEKLKNCCTFCWLSAEKGVGTHEQTTTHDSNGRRRKEHRDKKLGNALPVHDSPPLLEKRRTRFALSWRVWQRATKTIVLRSLRTSRVREKIATTQTLSAVLPLTRARNDCAIADNFRADANRR